MRRQPTKRPALLPFIIAVGVLVLGLYLVKLLLNIQRIAPSHAAPAAIVAATPSPSPSPAGEIIAPRALPVEGPPLSEASVTTAPTPTPEAPSPSPSPSEPEVRRAEPVHPEDFASPNVPTPPLANRVQITPMRKTFLRVTVDNRSEPVYSGWLEPSDPPLSFRGRHVTVKVLERGAVQITKNGAALTPGDADVTFE